jgi:hypothetical protein
MKYPAALAALGLLALAAAIPPPPAPAEAQTIPPLGCPADKRIVKPLGTFPGTAPGLAGDRPDWMGKTVCEITGSGSFGSWETLRTPADCKADGRQVAGFGPYLYCVWRHAQLGLLASIIQEPGTPPLPDVIAYPTPPRAQDNLDDPSHCTNHAQFVRVLGKWRGVTLCQFSGGTKPSPVAASKCPDAANPGRRIKVFPYDFTDVPPKALEAIAPGTLFCVQSLPFWDQRGTKAVLLAKCA